MLTRIKDKLKQVNWKDLIERALWSFVQGFLASLVVTGFTQDEMKIALIGALTGGLSALKTFILDMFRNSDVEDN
ncbi:MAG: hypothetical protein HFH45_01395 [Bacilli bacterium]|nr:hypothetical protein [Bacilli bacterium]